MFFSRETFATFLAIRIFRVVYIETLTTNEWFQGRPSDTVQKTYLVSQGLITMFAAVAVRKGGFSAVRTGRPCPWVPPPSSVDFMML